MNRNLAGPFHDRRVADGAAGTCVTHGTKQSAAPGRTLFPNVPETDRSLSARAPTEVAVNLKKVVTWLVVAFVIFYVIQAPEAAAQIVRTIGTALGNAASSFAAFIGSLV